MKKETLSRRHFLQGATASTLMFALAAHAEEKPAGEAAAPAGPPLSVAVIGTGTQGRALLQTLGRQPGANVAAICDSYAASMTGATKYAPKAAKVDDYRRLLDDKSIAAVFVATPSHLHRQIAIDALQAGKHVYCEAPLAVTLEDAKAIAQAGKAAGSVFQVGQQLRSHRLYHHAMKFVHAGALGTIAQARAQWHRRQSWRRAAATPEREKALNWRLIRESSAGLLGEEGIHQIDAMSWAVKGLPLSVQGFGGVYCWRDEWEGFDAAYDTVQCVFEYPKGVRLLYDATLTNSFDGVYQVLMGSDAAVLLRETKAYLFKEADAAQLGWEVYAHREKIGDETGIALIADATSQLARAGKVESHADDARDALFFAVEEFLQCIREKKAPACGALEGYQAAVVAIKANEAVVNGAKLTYQPEWFEI